MAEKFVIHGGNALHGSVDVTGAKNAAVAILPATILADGVCEIENLPQIADVRITQRILEQLGAKTEEEDGVLRIDTAPIHTSSATFALCKRLRASYYFIGALLARFGKAETCLPGGCAIGERPIDQHIKGWRKLGAEVRVEYGKICAEAPNGLHGADIFMDVVSVGATINIMLAAVYATGVTTIVNAAKEPHVVDVANFLISMGAKIKGAGTDVIKIFGVDHKLHGCNYAVIPDQIETGTLMIAAAATRGDVTVRNVIPRHMEALTAKLLEMGISVEDGGDYLRVRADKCPRAVHIKTMPYPGFPTDLQQPATVLLSTADGTSIITESIFEARFKHIKEIRRMGANIAVEDKVAVVTGVPRLTGTSVRATDLRAGAALIVAGLMADGTTEIHNIKYIDRGYDHIEDKLNSLGAQISRVPEEVTEEDMY